MREMAKAASEIRIARAYNPVDETGCYRVLVDRIWPRGISRDKLALDEWLKEIAPSTKLRQWFGHRPERWDRFREQYFEELDQQPEVWKALLDKTRKPLLLIYGAKDREHNNAVALREYLTARRKTHKSKARMKSKQD